MATTGYKLSSSEITSGGFDPTSAKHLFYTNGFWWLLARDSTVDWFLWKKDLSTPAVGSGGGWTKITSVEPEGRTTASIDAHWNEANQTLHVLSMHSTLSRYNQYTYNSGLDSWTHTVIDESFPIAAISSSRGAITSDNNNIPLVATATNVNYTFHHRTGGTWTAGNNFETGSTLGAASARIDIFMLKDGTGQDYVGAMYSYTGTATDGWRFAKMLTTANYTTESWTTELAAAPNNGVDDHISVVAYVPSGETNSRIVAAVKNGGNDSIFGLWRESDGTWSPLALVDTASTRPKVAVDATNGKLRVMAQRISADDVNARYWESDLTDPLVFGTAQVWVEDDGVGDDFSAPGVSQDAYTSDTGWLQVVNGPADAWWNEETIAGGAGEPAVAASGGAAPGAVKRRNAAAAAMWYRQMAAQRKADLAKQEELLKKFRR